MDRPAPSRTVRRSHELRIAVEGGAPSCFHVEGLVDVLNGALVDWQAAPLLAGDTGIWLITGHVEERVGTAEYACRAHSLVQRVIGTGTVARAEADIPVTAFVDARRLVDRSVGYSDFPPGSDDRGWGRDVIRCEEAWAIEPTRGGGIRIGHPDTGYTLHPNIGAEAFDLDMDRDFLSDDDDALDPLVSPADSPWLLPFPGHGTTTASVMVGRGSERTGIVGVAPGSRVVPLRAAESVVQLFDSDVARAVDHARLSGCHVVSISVGGKGFFGLRSAIQRAVDSGMIVVAAAGNNVGIVVAPASYPNCLAVAATGPDDQPWPESSRGSQVDVCAPGWGVHVAGYVWVDNTPEARVFRSSGTSYAATHLAGVAALWLAHHTPDRLRQLYGPRVQAVFLHMLRAGGSRVPVDWDAAVLGAGIVDAAAMLTLPLPDLDDVGAAERVPEASPLSRLSALVNLGEGELAQGLAAQVGTSGEQLDTVIERFEGELAFHLVEHADFRTLICGGSPERCGTVTIDGSSPEFRVAFGMPGAEEPYGPDPDLLSRA